MRSWKRMALLAVVSLWLPVFEWVSANEAVTPTSPAPPTAKAVAQAGVGLPKLLVSGTNPQLPVAPPPRNSTRAADDPKRDAHLAAWEKQARSIRNLSARFTMTRTEPVFGEEWKFSGSLLHLNPKFIRFRIEDAATKDYDTYVGDGRVLYHYSGSEKIITEFQLKIDPTGTEKKHSLNWLGQRLVRHLTSLADPDQSILFFCVSGLPPRELKQRFTVTLFKEDENYIYLDLLPRHANDQQEIQRVRITLYGPNVKGEAIPYTPAQLWVEKPNGETELWKYDKVLFNIPEVNDKVFRFEEMPPPWKKMTGTPPTK